MNREDAVDVIRKIRVFCGSFPTTQAVLIHDKKLEAGLSTLLGFLSRKKTETLTKSFIRTV